MAGSSAENNNNDVGWVLGGGVEYTFTNNLTVKLEGLWVNLDRGNNNTTSITATAAASSAWSNNGAAIFGQAPFTATTTTTTSSSSLASA